MFAKKKVQMRTETQPIHNTEKKSRKIRCVAMALFGYY